MSRVQKDVLLADDSSSEEGEMEPGTSGRQSEKGKRKQVGNVTIKAKRAKTSVVEEAQLEGKRAEKGKSPSHGGKALTMEDMPSIVAAVVKAMKEASAVENEDERPLDDTPPG